ARPSRSGSGAGSASLPPCRDRANASLASAIAGQCKEVDGSRREAAGTKLARAEGVHRGKGAENRGWLGLARDEQDGGIVRAVESTGQLEVVLRPAAAAPGADAGRELGRVVEKRDDGIALVGQDDAVAVTGRRGIGGGCADCRGKLPVAK